MIFSGDVYVKKTLPVIDFRVLLYAFLFFFFNMFSVPAGEFIFNFSSMQFNRTHLIKCIITTILLLLFTIIFATIVKKIETAPNGINAFLAMLLVADPLSKSIRLNIATLTVLIITILLCFYLKKGESLTLKTILVAAYAFILPMFCLDLGCSFVPLVVLVFGMNLFEYERNSVKPVYKKKNKQKGNNFKQHRKSIGVVVLLFFLIILAAIMNKSLSKIPLFADMMFSLNSGIVFSYEYERLWLAVIPYVITFIVFVSKYFCEKKKSQKLSIKTCFAQSIYLIVIALILAVVAINVFVLRINSGFTVFNILLVSTIMIMSWYDPQIFPKVFESLSVIYQKYKIVLWVLLIIWFILVQSMFRDMIYPEMNNITNIVGGRL